MLRRIYTIIHRAARLFQQPLRLCSVSGSDLLSRGDAGVNGVAEGKGHAPVGASSLDDGDE